MGAPSDERNRWGGSVRELSPVDFFVKELVARLSLGDNAASKRARRLIWRLASRTTSEGIQLEQELVFDPDTVERFCEVALKDERSLATYRSVLRAIGPQVTTGAAWQPPAKRIARKNLAPPYTKEEVALLWQDARNQPTSGRRHAAEVLLCLGLGAGIDGRWAGKVRPDDVTSWAGAVFVAVDEPSARTVVVRAEYEERLLSLKADCRDRFLIGGRSVAKNRVGNLVASMLVPTRHPPLAPARLRSTWLLAHLDAGTRIPELCRAGGLKGTGGYADLLEFLSPLPEHEAVEMLRMAGR